MISQVCPVAGRVRLCFAVGASLHVPGTAHEIALPAQAICAVPGTLVLEPELRPGVYWFAAKGVIDLDGQGK